MEHRFNISPSSEYSGLISFKIDWLDLLAAQGILKESSPTSQFKSTNSLYHIIKGFSVVNEAEVDVFLEFSCFFNDPMDVGNLVSGSSAF